MLKEIQDFTFQAQKNIVPWLSKHNTIWSFASKIRLSYAELTGTFHILPSFLIIGAKKSGTTSLYLNLVKHPEVVPSFTKEINYFNKYYYKSLNWYRSNFPLKLYQRWNNSVHNKQLISGEATPTYIYHPHVPKRVKQVNPNMKIIAVLRNPIERAFSHYQMEVRHGNESLSFEDATRQEEKRISGEFNKMYLNENYYSQQYEIFSYISSGIYVEQLERWFNYFPKEQILIINNDDFKYNLEATFNQVFSFLNLSKFNISNYKEWEKGSYKDKIASATRVRLQDFYKPYNEKLYSMIKMNFNWK